MSDLKERLLTKRQGLPKGVAIDAALVNPDGPEAVARIEKLEAALERFAKIKAEDGDDFSSYPAQAIIRCEITAEDLHVARQALQSGEAR